MTTTSTAIPAPVPRSGLLDLLSLVGASGLVGLFPLYFIYHFITAGGLVPTFLGGMFGAVTALVAALSLLPYLIIQGRFGGEASRVQAMSIGFLAYVLVWMGLNTIFPRNIFLLDAANQQILTALVSWFSLFITGIFAPQENIKLKRIMFAFWILMIGLTFLNFDRAYLILDIRQGNEVTASYKELARSVCFSSLFVALVVPNRPQRLALLGISTIALFVIGSRSEMLSFAIAAFLGEALRARRSAAGYAMLGIIGLFAMFFIAQNLTFLLDSRLGSLFDLAADQSWRRRDDLQSIALQQIGDEPLMGVYGGHILAGDESSYAHNALSAWVSFGLLGFILYLLPTLYCAVRSGLACWRNPESTAWNLSLAVNVIALLSVLTNQSFVWTLPALGWGLAVRALLKDQQQGSALAKAPQSLPPSLREARF